MTAVRSPQKVQVRTHANGRTLECEMTLRDDRCHTCNASVWWVRTPAGKALIVDADAEADVLVSHWLTCPQARQWSGKRRAAVRS